MITESKNIAWKVLKGSGDIVIEPCQPILKDDPEINNIKILITD